MHAFGLTVDADVEVAGLLDGTAAKRRVRLDGAVPAEVVDAALPLDGALLVDRRGDEGELLTVHRDDRGRWRFDAPAHGSWVVTDGGTRVVGHRTAGEHARGDRLLHAQVLPLAATLQGLVLLHASAVVLDGRAVVLAGVSGAGKSSVALHLRDGGAGFLADDAAALELWPTGPVVHPGPAIARVATEELARVRSERAGRRAAGDNGKEQVRPPDAVEHPVPLGAVVILERDVRPPGVSVIGHPRPVDALLGSVFVPAVRMPATLERLLDVAVATARDCAVLRATTAAPAGAAETAAAIARAL